MFVLIFVVYDYVFNFHDYWFRDIEIPFDLTDIISCNQTFLKNSSQINQKLYKKKHKRIFKYMFIGCQLEQDVVKALHPDVFTVADNSGNGDIILKDNYGYDKLGYKSKAFLEYICEKELYSDYDIFVKQDEDCFSDISSLNFDNVDLFGYWQTNNTFTGMIYGYSGTLIEKICKNNYLTDLQVGKWEDQFISLFMSQYTTNKCSLRNIQTLHKIYKSRRLHFYFQPYLKCEYKNQ
jgi:hypothetical protein